MPIDFKKIDSIFSRASSDNRDFLLEQEVYAMLKLVGIAVPRHKFVPKGKKLSAADVAAFKSDGLVLKIVAPLIQHKTDVGGVAFVKATSSAANTAINKMLADIPARFLSWAKTHSHGLPANLSESAVSSDIRGVLVCEKVDFEKFGFGSELLLGARNSREFGPVVTMGSGGVEVEYLGERLKPGTAAAMASAHLLEPNKILAHLSPIAVYDKLVKPFRGKPAPLKSSELQDTYQRLQALAAHYSPFKPSSRYVIEEVEVNPFVVRSGRLFPLDGLCRFSRAHVDVKNRPVAAIKHLLKPESVAIIGVSEKMNLGHIILNNVLEMGFPKERVYVVKPGLSEIEGCKCVPTVAELPETVDMFVLTLAAEQCEPIMRDLTAHQKARSVIIIAGGMGEKAGTQSIEQKIVDLLAENRKAGRPTPVANGGNCLGIYSKPGCYDTTFIPRYKLRYPKTGTPGLAYVSQSGAFMISRISRLHRFEPLYAVSLGNQIDLRVSDYLNYLKDEPEVKVVAVYLEGFKPGDGYLTAEAAREIVRTPGRYVIAYKSGRSPEGRLATSSHTASVAGDYGICKAILEEAGVIVADTIFEFQSFLTGALMLGGKKVAGNRAVLMSNAGFESVIMSDNLRNGDRLELAVYSEETKRRIGEALASLGIDKFQDVRNPLDTTPVANDAAFAAAAKAVLDDPGVDCAVISPLPMTGALQTIAPGEGHKENIYDPGSVGKRLIEIFKSTDKPFIVNLDAGPDYDPMTAMLEEAGIPVFRDCDAAVKFLRRFVGVRLRGR
ncbi:MAG: acetate--CoA ligase family protein [Candidatus Aminicenantes bacterium]|nr:acetate--CoA ligase family protein [Candidatus Aminicenantes bacterium]